MLDSRVLPKEIFERRNEIGLEYSFEMLAKIAETEKKESKRKDAIKYLGLLLPNSKPLKKEIFELLESILISDKDIIIKCEAAKALGKTKYEKSLKPLKWILQQDDLDHKIKLTSLKAIANLRLEEPEIQLFIDQLSSDVKSITACVKNKLTLLGPNKLIKSLLESLKNVNFSEAHKVEILKLISFDISSISISFQGTSFLKVNYPDILAELINSKHELCRIITANLREDDRDLLNSSINLLNILGSEVNEVLVDFLEHDDFIVKQNAIKLMGKLKINDKEGMTRLIENLDDMYSEVSKASIEALGQIGELSSVPELLKILDIEDAEFEYIDLDMKWYILDAVKEIFIDNPNASYEYLYSGLEGDNELLKESISHIMGEIGRKEFIGPLINLLEGRNLDVRKNAIIALGKIGNKKAITRLLSLLDEDHIYWLLKKVSVDAIYNIYYRNWNVKNHEDSQEKRDFIINREKLIDFLKSHNNECFKVKLSFIKFFERFGDETALSILVTLVNDFHRLIRISAEKAIKTIEERLELEDNQS